MVGMDGLGDIGHGPAPVDRHVIAVDARALAAQSAVIAAARGLIATVERYAERDRDSIYYAGPVERLRAALGALDREPAP